MRRICVAGGKVHLRVLGGRRIDGAVTLYVKWIVVPLVRKESAVSMRRWGVFLTDPSGWACTCQATVPLLITSKASAGGGWA